VTADSFTRVVQFEFIFNRFKRLVPDGLLSVNGRQIPMLLVRNPRARRYVLRVRPDGSARVTIPRGGSTAEARRFAERNQNWLERQFQRLAAQPNRPVEWIPGAEIMFRGELVKLEGGVDGESGVVRFGGESVGVPGGGTNLRPPVERFLWKLASKELPSRVFEFAALHQLLPRRVTVRNQRSRWGSCSRRGTISLNWRLVQAPLFVRDYIILHELCHLKEMNHSRRFWREVERVCPDYRIAERWLKEHSGLIL
jgi:predicted metal-dependent hydrolase